MKFGAKIFFCVTIFFSIIFLLGGYVLISFSYKTAMELELELAMEQYQYNKFVMQATLITRGEQWLKGVEKGEYDVSNMAGNMNGMAAFFTLDNVMLFSNFPQKMKFSKLLTGIEIDKVNYQYITVRNRAYLLIAGLVTGNDSDNHSNSDSNGKDNSKDTSVYLLTGMDIEKISKQQEQIISKFGGVYFAAVFIGVFLIFGLSAFLTRPIKSLTIATKKIVDGNYQERVKVFSGDEVGQLARNFNQMVCAIEEKIQQLSEIAKQKEDFVANFAHELKTPLTSIIGYANRIYQKELPREEQIQASWYIWNEGMRLEALAFKLMDLTVLNHKNFILQEMRADLLLWELTGDLGYLLDKKKIVIDCFVEPAYIYAEYDLFKTLFTNLIDNAIKAGANHIIVRGNLNDRNKNRDNCIEIKNIEKNQKKLGIDFDLYYMIQIEDNGCGIPEKELKRITEAFYMIDKSRSRKLHGAGIGLSLAEKIAQIHGSNLKFESDGENGTKVTLCLKCKREGEIIE